MLETSDIIRLAEKAGLMYDKSELLMSDSEYEAMLQEFANHVIGNYLKHRLDGVRTCYKHDFS
jgi:hypothetical protein